ncbi:Hypp6668 [Branchiostoma lanceolatum]|uniref:Gypsy retrotransposon integrase-like protein 1 n=1 Tax=Branchiostoma lanceolatum TaxID=7740 RepID=A0A8J9YV87_BRALA|nr:Hypp6668 [Branchiostoma lanceolatum]
MRREMLDILHKRHMGQEKTKARAKDILFWPGMNAQIEEKIQQCSICQEHQASNLKEPMIPQAVPERPLQNVATDLFCYNGDDFMIVTDYYSKFFEFVKLNKTKSTDVITKMKKLFATHGIPEKVVSDNGPQFASELFAKFAEEWGFKHVTASPRYPQSNGLAERSVQTAKRLLRKAEADKRDPYLALLDYRNTPIDRQLESPAQILMGRRLPTTNAQLMPRNVDHKNVKLHLEARQHKQKKCQESPNSINRRHCSSSATRCSIMSRRPHKPAGDTPDPSPKRARGRGQGHDNGSRRELYHSYSAPGGILDSFSNKEHGKSSVPWTKDETAAIVKYVALYHTVEEGKQWPTSNFLASMLFWQNCGKFVSEETGKPARPEDKEDEEEDCGIDGRKKLLRLASLEQEVDVLAEAMKEICCDLGVVPMQENSTSVETSTKFGSRARGRKYTARALSENRSGAYSWKIPLPPNDDEDSAASDQLHILIYRTSCHATIVSATCHVRVSSRTRPWAPARVCSLLIPPVGSLPHVDCSPARQLIATLSLIIPDPARGLLQEDCSSARCS